MKKLFVFLLVSFFIIYGGLCLAGTPKGLEKTGKDPKGFSQGKKSGWDGEHPKGWENFSKEEKEAWQNKHGNTVDDDEIKSKKKSKDKKEKHKKGKKKE